MALSNNFRINDDWALVPSAGLRFYDHNKFESKIAPHAGLSLMSDKVTVFANVSRGINHPGLEAPALRSRDTLTPNTTKVGAFASVNARLSYPLAALGKKGEIFLAVKNLFDRDYEYRPGYAMPGSWDPLTGLAASVA